jgi:hypothetical protein
MLSISSGDVVNIDLESQSSSPLSWDSLDLVPQFFQVLVVSEVALGGIAYLAMVKSVVLECLVSAPG